jgi:hypothetical protein
VTRRRLVAQAIVTGAWLGLVQVALGFAAMAGAGGTAALFFALLFAWIAGGAAGALRGRPVVLLGAALVLAVGARAALATWPFEAAPLVLSLVAGAAAGAYAGAFFRERAALWGDVRALLLWENNGFVAGYLIAGTLLLVSGRILDATAITLGVALLADRIRNG